MIADKKNKASILRCKKNIQEEEKQQYQAGNPVEGKKGKIYPAQIVRSDDVVLKKKQDGKNGCSGPEEQSLLIGYASNNNDNHGYAVEHQRKDQGCPL